MLLLTDIYPACEEPIPGVTAEALARAIASAATADVAWVGDLRAAARAAGARGAWRATWC